MSTIADKLIQIAQNQQELYGKGFNNGYDQGLIDGKQAEYDKFWDVFQDYGNRTIYEFLGANQYRFGEWFYPKYDIKPTLAQYFMRDMRAYNGDYNATFDMVERLKECGVTMDFSNCTNVTYLFYQARISHLPEINVINAGNTASTLLFGAWVETIDKFIFNESQTLNNTFGYCSALKNIVFEGVYKAGGLNMKWSTSLSKESITSLINCLATDTSDLTVTLSLAAVNKAFETSEGANDGENSIEWKTLANTRENWTINLS